MGVRWDYVKDNDMRCLSVVTARNLRDAIALRNYKILLIRKLILCSRQALNSIRIHHLSSVLGKQALRHHLELLILIEKCTRLSLPGVGASEKAFN